MNLDRLLEALLGTKGSFESALARVRDADAGELIVRLLHGLEAAGDIENSERERRLSSAFMRASPKGSDLISIGEAGATSSNAVLRNALIQLMPPELKTLTFQGKQAARSGVSESADTGGDLTRRQDAAPIRPAALTQQHDGCSDVIVLSIDDDPATKRLLESAGFVPLRCPSVEELDRMLETNDRICAFLVESSFLKPLDRTRQVALLTKLARFSTLVWLRLQEDGLFDDSVRIGEAIARARCRPSQPEILELSFRDKSGLQERELPTLHAARDRLMEGEAQSLFIPGELGAPELKLLGAAMSQYSKRRQFNPGAELTKVTTKFLQGGQTGARVALVKVNDLRVPVIIKLDKKDAILDEARRFLTFIHKDNRELNPEVHLHGGAALIVFGVIPDPDAETEEPAPTLDQRLTEYWYGEMRDPMSCDDGALIKGFTDAARRLSALNKQRCSNTEFECRANPYLVSLKEMEKRWFNWGFAKERISERDRAESVIGAACGIAVCHGDAHTRNVLIRGEQGFLSDYAYSGPGHPCSDLVKLELSVYLTRFVQLGTEAELRELQFDISVNRLQLSELLLEHKSLLRSRTNQLCLRMCVTARDMVAEVLEAHKLPWEHYTASKVLAAWQALQAPSLQQSLARGVISALAS